MTSLEVDNAARHTAVIEIDLLDEYHRNAPRSSDKEGQENIWIHNEKSDFPPVPYHRRAKDEESSLSPRLLNRKMIARIKSYNTETGRVLSSDEAGKWGNDQGQFLDHAVRVAHLIARQQQVSA
jgi:hypothetical protein